MQNLALFRTPLNFDRKYLRNVPSNFHSDFLRFRREKSGELWLTNYNFGMRVLTYLYGLFQKTIPGISASAAL